MEMVRNGHSTMIRTCCISRYIDMMAENSTPVVTLARWTWLGQEPVRASELSLLRATRAPTHPKRTADTLDPSIYPGQVQVTAMPTTYMPSKRLSCL